MTMYVNDIEGLDRRVSDNEWDVKLDYIQGSHVFPYTINVDMKNFVSRQQFILHEQQFVFTREQFDELLSGNLYIISNEEIDEMFVTN